MLAIPCELQEDRMIQPLRKNVLVDMGPPAFVSDTITVPDNCLCIGMKGTVIAVGPKCMNGLRIGDRVLVNYVSDGERVFRPRWCEEHGMAPHMHLLIPESKVAAVTNEA